MTPKIVVDSSMAFKWGVLEVDSDKARAIKSDYDNGLAELVAPGIFIAELAHALTRAERQRRIQLGEAKALWSCVMLSSPQFEPALPLTPRAIEISSAEWAGLYDCLYVALAKQEQPDFVTSDDKLVSKPQPKFPFVKALKAWG